ncbi:MAG TPA: sialate O-acetylesterase [Opitutales bacterium]|nr:sialate O-acetylesterase [Opitutales bacterium]
MPILNAEVKLAPLFSEGMVLQQKQSIPVWGWGAPGQRVTVEFGGQKVTGRVDSEGEWLLHLAALEASYESRELRVRVGDASTTVKDVLVGEVWICSGQSNMDYPLKPLTRRPKEKAYQVVSNYIAKELATAHDPYLRLIAVPHTTSFLEAKDTFEGRWVRGEKGMIDDFTATGYFFGRELREKLDVPVGLIEAAWGNTPVESYIPKAKYREDEVLDQRYTSLLARINEKLSEYDEAKERSDFEAKLQAWEQGGRKGGKPRLEASPLEDKYNPGTLFNGMIHPLIPYAMRGCIWYQGEANRFLPEHYSRKMAALIESWREVWGIGDFPFYYVQLANYSAPKRREGWVQIQNEQRLAMQVKNSGMAVINDTGEFDDIHPRNKIDVGKRLAAWALANDYGFEMAAYCGPIYRDHTIDGNTITVSFDHTGSGLMAGVKNPLEPTRPSEQPLRHFEIAGKDGEWKAAAATIVSPDQVVVSHPEIEEPIDVRYAWSSYSEGANLYNKQGFPASLFTTAAE